jgi:hypothetical protein
MQPIKQLKQIETMKEASKQETEGGALPKWKHLYY